ncbi:molybdopterin-dependent oxidoreductase [Mycolicibacterium austroafricanum]|uniref:Xanthine dehydrogenase family protein n=1 Tax=Mycolicibacterium austroafricanum TaxID=39687 RepID=A0ABT8HPC5_MYCAO|nr:xanthine dehydrogenase family protein [Mycolicibacterium austroafricanum]MDN4522613.1 xanthine dehydrogenase family protein [Mycolicibacterium austroafricanum]PQP41520.1 xanthine dehydrogenase subunit D [Mycolicibacterium austroafricanum]QRZ07026.1 molybdopterin-dependent oxidoreductase [Mycolicibacterium austroafricanum]QZT68512.1 molybdopterin-dependent oxidoreductase [Mycolicibacterium austroafricanum]
MNTGSDVPASIGVSAPRSDAATKLAGHFTYATQVHAVGELHAATVRSYAASAMITRMDATAAMRLPGAVAVLTGADIPGRRLGSKTVDQPVLADGVVRYHGEPVAVVIAETPGIAQDMVRAVAVGLALSSAVLNPEDALQPGAPGVGPDGNLVAEHHTRRGNSRGAVVIRRRWRTGRQDAAFLAPEAGVAQPFPDGSVHLTIATQDIHADHAQVVRALGLTPGKLVVHNSGIGGAFGGREDITLHVHLVLAALHTGRPVRMAYSRRESLTGHPSRHPMVSDVELTCRPDGRFVSLRARTVLDGGAYASTSAPVSAIVHDFSAGLYRFAAVDVRTRAVYTNNPPAGAMRGFGATQACFLIESTVDAAAAVLGRDPVDLRRQNLLHGGEALAITGQALEGCADPHDLLDAAVSADPPAAAPHPDRHRGTGLALGIKSAGLGHGKPDPATAAVSVSNGQVTVQTTAAEVGQGVTDTLRRIVGAQLPGLPVTVTPMPTTFPTAGGSKASRQTMASGGAAHRAAVEVRRRLDAEFGNQWTPETVIRQLGAREIRHQVTYDGPRTSKERPHKAFQLVAHRMTVDVDSATGQVAVLQAVCVQDCGRAIDPVAVREQLIGGTVQGVGFALWEERLVDAAGTQLTTGFGDYLAPTAADVGEVVTRVLEVAHPDLTHGAKGIGEGPLVSSPAAVAAAVRAASGRPVEAIPLWSPEPAKAPR